MPTLGRRSPSRILVRVLREVFSKGFFPELARSDFYFAGESYAGVLVPTLIELLLDRRTKANSRSAPWSVKGFALGNDCPGNKVFTCTPYSGWIGTQVALDFRFRHGMISEPLYARVNEACQGQWGTYSAPSQECQTLLEDPVRPVLEEAGDTYEMGGGYYLYDTCGPDLLALDAETHRPRAVRPEEYTVAHLKSASLSIADQSNWYPNSGSYACGQSESIPSGSTLKRSARLFMSALNLRLGASSVLARLCQDMGTQQRLC